MNSIKAKIMTRNINDVSVTSPDGTEVFEVSRLNAIDLVQHKGFAYTKAKAQADTLAHAARGKTDRARKKELMLTPVPDISESTSTDKKNKGGRPKKPVALDIDLTDETPEPFDKKNKTDLSINDLEDEEEERLGN
jgi:hypothetical protein